MTDDDGCTSEELSPSEFQTIVYDFNRTLVPLNQSQLIHHAFESITAAHPDRPALFFGDQSLCYSELNKAANRLAHLLLRLGPISPDTTIGLMVERSPFAVTAMLAVLKAGGAYVPIDPTYPAERRAYLVENSGARLVIAERNYPWLADLGVTFVLQDDPDLATMPIDKPTGSTTSGDLAYVIYTSGSTGRPKGVMVEHRSIVNLVDCINREYSVGANDRLLLLSSLCFDLSAYDIFGALSVGAALVLIGPDEVADPFKLLGVIEQQRITVWNSVPSTMTLLVEALSSRMGHTCATLRLVMLSGDWIPLKLPQAVRSVFPGVRVVSLGGATEGTVWSCHYRIGELQPHWKSIPYGYPLANNFFYVLNEQRFPVPRGAVGELYIGGIGVARGYIGDLEKSAQAFVDDPFHLTLGGRMYRTGDLGRLTEEGHLEILGRRDKQVKVRGYRVELGEIEHALERHPHVAHAVVACVERRSGEKELAASVVIKPGVLCSVVDLREHLKSSLPAYMVPALFAEIPALPLGPNGKLDRSQFAAALPPPVHGASLSKLERQLHDIWSEELGIPDVSLETNLIDLGCSSLAAVRLVVRIEQTFQVELSLPLLLGLGSLSAVARHIKDQARGETSAAPTTTDDATEVDALTGLQMSYYLGATNLFPLGCTGARVLKQFRLGKAAAKNINRALDVLIAAHPVLRSVIVAPGHWKVLPDISSYRAEVVDLSHLDPAAAERAMAAHWRRAAVDQNSFPDTERWPLFAFTVFRLNGPDDGLQVRFHLALFDGLSLNRFFAQLDRLLLDPTADINPPRSTYADYRAQWQQFKRGQRYEEAQSYWQAAAAGLPDPPRLATVKPVTEVRRSSLDSRTFWLDPGHWERLVRAANERKLSPGIVVYGVFARVLACWSAESRFTVNVLLYNREPLVPRVHDILANFSSTILVETDARQPGCFSEFVQRLQYQQVMRLRHAVFDGVDVLNERNRLRKSAQPSMPVVFTSLVGLEKVERSGAITENATAVQTPHVYLDCLIRDGGGTLEVLWSTQDDMFPTGMIDDMLWAFKLALNRLAEDKMAWELPLTIALPPYHGIAQSAARRFLGAAPALSGYGSVDLTCHVLDDELQDRPISVPGRLYVSGPQVALRAADRVAAGDGKNAVTHPQTGDLLHDTGYVVCLRSDGRLEPVGPVTVREGEERDTEIDALLRRAFLGHAPQAPAADLSLEAPDRAKQRIEETKTVFVRTGSVGATEQILERLWRDLLGPIKFGVDDNFFDLGGQSLMAARLVTKLRMDYQIELPLSVIYAEGTIRRIAGAIDVQAVDKSASIVIPIWPDGSKEPLYCIHALGGNTAHFRPLAERLGANGRPVYGIRAFGLERNETPIDSINSMAAHYIQEIRRARLPMPYRLAGWSFGGLVAYEMARQLEQSGEAVSCVLLIDTSVPPRVATVTSDSDIIRSFSCDVQRHDDRGSRMHKPAAELPSPGSNGEPNCAGGQTEIDLGAALVANLFRVYAANRRALETYDVEPIRSPVVLFQARKSAIDCAHGPAMRGDALGWRDIVAPAVVELEGDHESIMQPPHVGQLAEAVAIVLDRDPVTTACLGDAVVSGGIVH